MKSFLEKILHGKTLTIHEAAKAMALICNSETCLEQVIAFLTMIHLRGETTAELLGFLMYLRQQSVPIKLNDTTVIDTCGTGGDYSNTFNISTATALLLASHGVKVAKHGGRSVSSRCGSADVLEALGIPIQKDVASIMMSLNNFNFAFLFAPQFNHALQRIRSLRQKLAIRTSFNLLGVLLNPVNVKRQVLGVYSKHLLMPVAEILCQLGSEEVMVVHSEDGLDEFSIGAPTHVAHLKENNIHCYCVKPDELGISYAAAESLQGGNAKVNANMIEEIFSKQEGPRRDVVVLNAAAGFIVTGAASSFLEGIAIARSCIDSGKTKDFLINLKHFYRKNSNGK